MRTSSTHHEMDHIPVPLDGEWRGWSRLGSAENPRCFVSPGLEYFKSLPVHELTGEEKRRSEAMVDALFGGKNRKGYYVIDNIMSPDTARSMADIARKVPDDDWLKDFGSTSGASRTRDSRRRSLSVPICSTHVVSFTIRIRDQLRRMGVLSYSHMISRFTFLKALDGSEPQAEHTDYDLDDDRYEGREFPMGILIAFDDNTTFTVKGEEIRIPRHGAVVFRGDLLHNGSGFARENLRAHMYVVLDEKDITTDAYGNIQVHITKNKDLKRKLHTK